MAAQEFGGNVVSLHGARERRQRRTDEPRVTKKDVAARYGVSEKTVERYMKRGLPHEKPHERGAVRFVMSEVEEWWRGASTMAAS